MKAKFGAIVTEGRGKIGGHVASKNRAGAYFRTKVTPVNPQSISQLGSRNRFSEQSQAWRGLTDAQRDAWNGAVADYAKTDIFGDLRNPTGAQLYQRLNNNLVNIGQSVITMPPAVEAVFALTSLSLAVAEGAGTMVATFTGAIPVGTSFLVFATPAISAGKSFVKNLYRQIGVFVNTDVSPLSIATEYEAKFGDIAGAGQKIFVQFKAVNETTGQAGVPVSASAIISA
ncbi:MAG: hypothetical protein WC297_03555 [Candidatus Paceibacterota bacterium]|jgi:hypothetical protein